MFTGLIEHVGLLVRVRTAPQGPVLHIDLGPLAQGLTPGESVAVDGVCLTATCVEATQASFDVTPTTLDTTTLGGLGPGRRVNLDRLGGHLVAGHVDGLATLQRWSPSRKARVAYFQTHKTITDLMIPKGSLAVNGVKTDESFVWSNSGDKLELNNLTAKGTDNGTLPVNFSLNQNYPNPFNPTTTISFTLPTTGKAKLQVYNLLGMLVATPFDGVAKAGLNEIVWDGRNSHGATVASGIYFYRLTADNYTETKKMTLLK